MVAVGTNVANLSEIVAAASRPDDYLFRRQSHRRRRGEDYLSVLSRELGLPVINTASAGDTTAEALARYPTQCGLRIPGLVIVLLGGNDFLRQVARQETRKNLEEIVQRIQAQSAMVAIAGVKLGLFTDEYGSIFEEMARQFGALYMAQVLKGVLTDSGLRSDRSNPNDAGYRMIAERIAAKIKPLLREADGLRGPSGLGSDGKPRVPPVRCRSN